MCHGDDVNCPHFAAHYKTFKEDMNVERRGFLKSSFAAAGGLAALGAGTMTLVTPELAKASAAKQPAKQSYHYLPANADTVHWGYFSKTLKPQVEVESGDIVTIETLTHHAGDDLERMVKGDEGAESVYLWTKDKKGVDRRGAGPTDPAVYKKGSGEGMGVHIMTGPVYVRGAEPGDILERSSRSMRSMQRVAATGRRPPIISSGCRRKTRSASCTRRSTIPACPWITASPSAITTC